MRSKAMKVTATACMPRLTRPCRASTARPAASVSLLERIRDVVLRLIMLSAVSKASVQRGNGGKSPRSPRPASPEAVTMCRRDDSIRNEAVEDCIEFLKRSSAEWDTAKASDVTAEAATVESYTVRASNGSEVDRVSTVVRREASQSFDVENQLRRA